VGKYNEFKELNLAQVASGILEFWKREKVFEKSVSNREGKTPFTFYEGHLRPMAPRAFTTSWPAP